MSKESTLSLTSICDIVLRYPHIPFSYSPEIRQCAKSRSVGRDCSIAIGGGQYGNCAKWLYSLADLFLIIYSVLRAAGYNNVIETCSIGGKIQYSIPIESSEPRPMQTELPTSIHVLRATSPLTSAPFTYLLRYDQGVIVFGTQADMSPYSAVFKECGPVTHILLGDRHHAGVHTIRFAEQVGVPLSASKSEAVAVKPIVVGNVLPYQRTTIVDGLEAIPTPGHTRGAFSYLWTHAGKRYLFVGDSIVPINGVWEFWVTRKNRAEMRESMQLLAKLEFDVILSNSFASTPYAWMAVDSESRATMFADLIARLEG